MSPKLHVIGVGCDGYVGLSTRAVEVLSSARRIIGSPHQLHLLADVDLDTELSPWPGGFRKDWQTTLADVDPVVDVTLASRDPMFHGVSASLVRELGRGAVKIIPAPSSTSLTCAYLGWPVHDTPVVSPVTGESGMPGAAHVVPTAGALWPSLVLYRNADSVKEVATVLADHPDAKLTVLTNLGGTETTRLPESVAADTVANPSVPAGNPTVLAAKPSGSARGWLRNGDFDSDDQLTKAPIRQVTVAALDPRPGTLLWNVGGGTGPIGVERAQYGGRVEIFERDDVYAERIAENVAALSGSVTVHHGAASVVLADSNLRPGAIFIGGGLTADDTIKTCWQHLAPRGTTVANTVTLRSETLLWQARRDYGGDVTRLSVERTGAVGNFTAWRPALPVVQWVTVKSVAPALP